MGCSRGGAEPVRKITAKTAAEICGLYRPAPEAKALVTADASPSAFLGLLEERGLLIDAIAFLARALPKREAVWWACMCIRETMPPDAEEPVRAALSAAEAWVYRPVEERRRAAMAAAEAASYESPESWAAMAAFWSGGSMAPPEAPIVPPGDDLTAHAVASAILLAAVRSEPERAAERHRLFLAKGRDIADGGTGRDVRPAS